MMNGKKLVVELRIFRVVQFINQGSKIFRSMIMPRKIRMIAPVRVIKI
jgi:uncharacterized protein YlzI (FlbEa/FlbD family)